MSVIEINNLVKQYKDSKGIGEFIRKSSCVGARRNFNLQKTLLDIYNLAFKRSPANPNLSRYLFREYPGNSLFDAIFKAEGGSHCQYNTLKS